MKPRKITTRGAFYARNAGVGINPSALCAHGDPAFVLDLVGSWNKPTGRSDDNVTVMLPRCVAAQLIGALTAAVTHTDGEQTARIFQAQADAALDVILPQISQLPGYGS
ncbi:hypothetical protein ACH3XX_00585 [Streptomyces scabiei]|uniref:hypothetical protein n=1 Tax=Streptomyces scabiei TaxID=1930 RepID=UPI00379DE677